MAEHGGGEELLRYGGRFVPDWSDYEAGLLLQHPRSHTDAEACNRLRRPAFGTLVISRQHILHAQKKDIRHRGPSR